MLNNFALWYRENCIKKDGRVIWWEHLITFLPLGVIPGLYLARYFQSFYPFLIGFMLGWLAGVWSYKQDLIAHNVDDGELTRLRDIPKVVPTLTKVSGIVFVVMLTIIIIQWIINGRY